MTNPELIASAEGRCEQHQADHSFRVMVLARKIFGLELTIAPEEIRQNPEIFREALDWAAVLHDREMSVSKAYDFEHGKRAAEKVDEVIGNAANSDCKAIIKFLCIFHVPDDNEIPKLPETQMWLLRVFKDADGLDRARFDNGDKLDEKKLRLEAAKKLIPAARELWGKTKQGFDNAQSAFDGVMQAAVEMGLVNRQ